MKKTANTPLPNWKNFPWPPADQLLDGRRFVRRLRRAGYRPPAGFAQGIERLCEGGGRPDHIVGTLVETEALEYSNPRLLADGIDPEELGSKDLSAIERSTGSAGLVGHLAAIGYLWEPPGPNNGNHVERIPYAAWRLGWSAGEMLAWLLREGLLSVVPFDQPSAPGREQVFLSGSAANAMERFVRDRLVETPPPVSWRDTGEHLQVTFAHTATGHPINLGSIYQRQADRTLTHIAHAEGTVSLPKHTELVLVPTSLARFGSPLRGIPADLFTAVEVVQGTFMEFGNADLAALSPLGGLKELSIGFTSVDGLIMGHGASHFVDDEGLLIVGHFEHLSALGIRSDTITDGGLERLSHLRLQSIAFGNGAVSSQGLARIVGEVTGDVRLESTSVPIGACPWLSLTPGIRRLGLSQVGLIDTDVPPLAPLPLTHLDVGGNSAHGRSKVPGSVGDHLAVLASDVPTLESVSVDGTDLTDRGATLLAALPRLERLSMWRTAITDRAVAAVAQSESLRRLHLGENPITDIGIRSLEGRPLTDLSLSDTSVSDASIEPILTMQHLESLDLTDTTISIEALERLRALPNLRRLTLGHIDDGDVIRRLEAALPSTEIEAGWL